MPTFYFDTDDGARAYRAQVGVELTSVEDASREALGLLQDLMEGAEALAPHTVVATVRDATGAVVLRTSLSLTVERIDP